jgi:hypothetical protein
MKALSNHLALVLGCVASGAFAFSNVGCSSGSSGDDNKGSGGSSSSAGGSDGTSGSAGTPSTNGCTGAALVISFSPMYSAFIPGHPEHSFQIPAIVNGVSGAGVTWGPMDSTTVKIEKGDSSGGVTITMLAAGEVDITATINGQCGTSHLTITEGTEDEWQLGSKRYNNGNPLPSLGAAMDGGLPPIPPMNFVIDPPDAPPACTNCHGDTATSSFFRTISHTPEQTGGFTDMELITIFTQASIPTLGYFDTTIIPQFAWNFFHKWSDITGDAQKGMVLYLRSLPPKPQGGMVDFGGFMRPGAGTGGRTGAGGSTATGGSTGSGGTTDTGGKGNTGGATSTGGASSGGTTAAGGAAGASTGGSGGASTGGSGGTAGAGGTAGSGGTSGAGGK